MRIIAGRLARRTVVAPQGSGTRPTADRVREPLFQHLEAARLPDGFDGLRVLDLFAGSGALSFEAISRGAARATLVEQDARAAAIIRRNAASLGLEASVDVVQRPVDAVLSRLGVGFDLVFADPPYALPLAPLAAAIASVAAPAALLVYEHARDRSDGALSGWTVAGSRDYGQTTVSFYLRSG